MRQLDASGASPLALAIASVAAKSARSVANSLERADTAGDVAADIGDFSTWQECACAGAIVGATGGAVVGLLGAGPIAVVELAAAGAVAGAAGFVVAEALLS